MVHCGLLYPFCFPLFAHSFQQLSGNSSSATFFASTAWTYISSSTRWQQSSIEFYNKAIMLCQAAVAHHQGESSELILHFPIQHEICIKMRAMSLFMASPPLWGEKSVQIINIFRFTHLHKYRLHGGVKLANEKCWSKSWNPGPLSDWPKLTLYVLRLGLKNKRNPFRIDDLQKNLIFLLWAFVILMLPPNNPKFSVRIM